ncbi:anhydro-N-acetylmuramic acid kinase [Myroides sp. DF42-4-2]|uniref:anhydro-N-acetylmuramic acid kinase n=1 Tax=unclassified Myroides TaxID=2642485 RepID=UPI0025768F98|nr:anhydro-N-acetylmuramic acid kinase [Myroides sp. DF42-4-2]MDM1408443.1 anhydro-N-acetylmuramic acid kinase [Myroides sp. DF42-4-2]
MKNSQYRVVGIMSGTSLDGVDLVYVTLNVNEKGWSFELEKGQTISYSAAWRTKLKTAIGLNKEALDRLDEEYTLLLADIITAFIQENALETVDFVCSHGHTILHRPDLGYTLQIGNLPLLADLIQHKVICDFRVQDVLLGGQGAPLVPIGDRLLFGDYTACLNLGGFANVSYENALHYRIAFDLCPVNVLLNEQANKLGLLYDSEGSRAQAGTVCQPLLEALNALEYYAKTPPKSLGVEFVTSNIQPLLELHVLSPEDYLATFVEHMAIQIANGIQLPKQAKILVTGGGAFNTYLMSRLSFYASSYEFVVADDLLVNYKEALIFALLGTLKVRDEVNALASVTGAQYDHSSGVIYDIFDPVW